LLFSRGGPYGARVKNLLALFVTLLPAAAYATDNPAVDAAAALPYGLTAAQQQAIEPAPIVEAPPAAAVKADTPAAALAQCMPPVPDNFMNILNRLDVPAGPNATGVAPGTEADVPAAPGKAAAPAASKPASNVTQSHGITLYRGPSSGTRTEQNGVQVFRGGGNTQKPAPEKAE